MIYYENMEQKKIVANDCKQISSNIVVKCIDFFPYLLAGLRDRISFELFSENEKNGEKKCGAVHYTSSVYKELLNLI